MTGGRAPGSRVRTVFLGSGGFGRESLWRLDGHDEVELVGVVTAPSRPAGRDQQVARTPIHVAADKLAVSPILTPDRLRTPDSIEAVLALAPELLVLADYGQIVPAPLLDLRYGALNLHPSLLPRHRGATPIPAAILAGDAETGVTLMRMDEGLDTGPIVAQTRVAVDGTETTPVLESGLALVAADLLAMNLEPWVHDQIQPRTQAADGATLTRSLGREDGRLDPHKTAVDLERQVRAFQPWPGSFIDTPVGRVIIWAARPSLDGPPTGTFDFEGLGTSDGGRLQLIEVQPAGGRRMSWDAFVRRRPSIIGARIVE